eukprot:m.68917 g.68917  ORF g.68917 m.68917 type:complete len:324 (-) comp13707_c1_seq1:331-1302(-)
MSRARVVLLGSGPSTGVPYIACLIRAESDCAVCREASENPDSRNHRGNPSLLIQYPAEDGLKNIVIDVGKTFVSGAKRLFPKLGVQGLDAVILSHDHADAVLGLDDLRSFHYLVETIDDATDEKKLVPAQPIETFCSDETMDRMELVFPYLVPRRQDEMLISGEPKRFVSWLNWTVVTKLKDKSIDIDPTFSVFGLEIQPLRMLHGGTYICLGFVFGPTDARIAYLSDVKVFPKATMDYLLSIKIDIMFIDCLYIEREHDTHIGLPEAVDVARKLRPRQTVLLGLTHEFDYNAFDQVLETVLEPGEDLNIAMGYDGMIFDVDL